MKLNEKPFLSRRDNRYSDELYHHGIKGQKWGVRRFQNLDRTWTEAGKIRYGNKKGIDRKHSEEKEGIKIRGSQASEVDLDELRKKNSKSELYKFSALLLYDIVTMNPFGLAYDTKRLGESFIGMYKNNKFSKEREENTIDPKTGFHLKAKELSPEEDLKRVNPSFNDFNSNSKSNCMLCTSTYEMRRRGYDVTANKASIGYDIKDVNKWFPKSKYIEFPNENQVSQWQKNMLDGGFAVNKKYAMDTIKKIEETQPNGSRGNIIVSWGYSNKSGHSMVYEIRDNKLVLLDGQANKVYKNPAKVLSNTSKIGITRLDNVDFDPKGIKECCI